METLEKQGMATRCINAVHPITGDPVPVWVANFVLIGYGTGAVMAVPGSRPARLGIRPPNMACRSDRSSSRRPSDDGRAAIIDKEAFVAHGVTGEFRQVRRAGFHLGVRCDCG